jgi:hypothetical protein
MRTLAFLAIGCAVLSCSPISLSSQISLGFQGKLTRATIVGPDVDYDFRKGWGLGAFLKLPVSDMLSIQPEILYLQKGAYSSWPFGDLMIALDYVEIPLLLRINVPVEGTVAPYFLVGPALGFKGGCEITAELNGDEEKLDCDETGFEVKSVDFGGVVGAGLSFGAGPGSFHLGARYNYGLISLDDSEEDWDLGNRAFSFLAGYSFPIGG